MRETSGGCRRSAGRRSARRCGPTLPAWITAICAVTAAALAVTATALAQPGAAAAAQAATPAAAASAPAAPADAIVGNWLTEARDGIIRISKSADGHYEGRIVGGNSPTGLDTHNPDPAQRGMPLLGLTILRGLAYEGSGRWSGGTIYDPGSGHTYRFRVELRAPDQLRVRGFLGVSLLGRSQIWTRYLGSSMRLPPAGR